MSSRTRQFKLSQLIQFPNLKVNKQSFEKSLNGKDISRQYSYYIKIMLPEGLVGVTLLCPHQFQCAFIPEFSHRRGARPHRGDAFSCVNVGVQSLRRPAPKPALCSLSPLVLSVWDCVFSLSLRAVSPRSTWDCAFSLQFFLGASPVTLPLSQGRQTSHPREILWRFIAWSRKNAQGNWKSTPYWNHCSWGTASERKTMRASGKKYKHGSGLFYVKPSPHSQSLFHSISCIDS